MKRVRVCLRDHAEYICLSRPPRLLAYSQQTLHSLRFGLFALDIEYRIPKGAITYTHLW